MSASPRRLATSARILPDGFVRPALYDEHTPIPRCESYPTTYHASFFPWLLSAERQRIPYDDLQGLRAGTGSYTNSSSSSSSHSYSSSTVLEAVAGCLPRSVRRYLAHSLNMHIAARALGSQAIEDVAAGAARALPRVAQLLSDASSGSLASAEELSRVFTQPLLSRFTNELHRLNEDSVRLVLEVGAVNSAAIRQIRTQLGPSEAFAALGLPAAAQLHPAKLGKPATAAAPAAVSAAAPLSSLRVGLARQAYHVTGFLGVVHAAPSEPAASAASALHNSLTASLLRSKLPPARVRVDVELNIDMRYRLIRTHKATSEYDRRSESPNAIVDDNATRNLMLTLESSFVCRDSAAPASAQEHQPLF
ncbi:hypothetical protein GGI12_005209, partial [Dipsacomyces acuminosporus]